MLAVVTADIVNSTKLDTQQYNQVMHYLQGELHALDVRFSSRSEIFRGDSMQAIYPNVADSIVAVLLLKLGLLAQSPSIKITQSLAVAPADNIVTELSRSSGEAFNLSGRRLDKLDKGDLSVLLAASLHNPALLCATELLNDVLHNVTQKQALCLYHYFKLNKPDQQLIADTLGMSRQNVSAHLSRGKVHLFRSYINAFQETMKECQ